MCLSGGAVSPREVPGCIGKSIFVSGIIETSSYENLKQAVKNIDIAASEVNIVSFSEPTYILPSISDGQNTYSATVSIKIDALALGRTDITVSLSDGNKAVCSITVIENEKENNPTAKSFTIGRDTNYFPHTQDSFFKVLIREKTMYLKIHL